MRTTRDNSNLLRARGRVAALERHRCSDDPELIEARRDLKVAGLENYIIETVHTLPSLTYEQRTRLAGLLLAEVAPRRLVPEMAPRDGMDVISMRDAADRAERMSTSKVALRALRSAVIQGDEHMAAAIARHAEDRGWSAVVHAYSISSGSGTSSGNR